MDSDTVLTLENTDEAIKRAQNYMQRQDCQIPRGILRTAAGSARSCLGCDAANGQWGSRSLSHADGQLWAALLKAITAIPFTGLIDASCKFTA